MSEETKALLEDLRVAYWQYQSALDGTQEEALAQSAFEIAAGTLVFYWESDPAYLEMGMRNAERAIGEQGK
jgi:hypothetical protein